VEDLKNMKVLVAELMEDEAIAILKAECQVDVKYKLTHEELLEIIPEYNAILVRSETQINESFLDAATNLKIVGRAGSGLDNINIPYATKKGVIVANTPESNIVSAAEHTMAMMLASSRKIPWANGFIKSGQWDRKRFNGSELFGKTLGVIGLGRIGSLVATRAQGFEMNVIAYDPYIPDSRFEKFGVEKVSSFEEFIKRADFITIHTPRTKETINIINDKEIEMMKEGVRLVNVARGGLYNEDAMERGMASGKIASCAIDVWNNEPQETHPLYKYDNVIGTPHLGASTIEAQIRVGLEVVSEVISGLKGEIVKNAVNMPSVSDTTFKKLKSFIELSEKIGLLYAQVRNEGVKKVEITFAGDEIDNTEDVKVLSLVTLKGILDASVPETVNFVNANQIAEQRGIEVIESIEVNNSDYSNLVRLKVTENSGSVFEICGSLLDKIHPRIVKVGEYAMDLVPEGKLIYAPHKNVPGVIGKVGTLTAEYGVNISRMIVADGKTSSIMALSVDNEVPEILIKKLKELDVIGDIKVINL
jgi:D-3-phosphoglycerate dehydrogenase / 2-oxoglutarate reductase